MVQRSNTNCAAVKAALTKSRKEECALGMGRHGSANYAAVMDARATLRKEECAGGMEQIAYEESIALISALCVNNSGLQFITS